MQQLQHQHQQQLQHHHQQQQQQQHQHQQQLQHSHHQQQPQQQQQQQQTSRSAASPLSPPRPGAGSAAAANTYPKFADVNAVREAPHRFIQQSSYSIGPGAQYRDSPYTRIPQMPPVQVQEYHRAAAAAAATAAASGGGNVAVVLPQQVAVSNNNNIAASHMAALHFTHPPSGQTQQLLSSSGVGVAGISSSSGGGNSAPPPPQNAGNIMVGRQRILLPPLPQTAQYPSDYLTNAAVAAVAAANRQQQQQQQQAPPDPGGQPYKKMRLSDSSSSSSNHLPPQIVAASVATQQQRQSSPASVMTSGGRGNHVPPTHHMQSVAHQMQSQPLHVLPPPTHLVASSVPSSIAAGPPSTSIAMASALLSAAALPPMPTAQQLKVETQQASLPLSTTPPNRRSTPTTNTSALATASSNTSFSSTEAYHPQVEAISPTLPNDNAEERVLTAKEDLMQQIQKVDTDIQSAENTMESLKKKEKTLAAAAAACKQQKAKQQPAECAADDKPKWRSQTLAQKIYEANRKTASSRHSILDSCGPRYILPLYNQPLDVEQLAELVQRHQSTIKAPLLEHVRKIKQERWQHCTGLVETYTQLSQEWLKRVEKSEASAKRKAREAKNREFFEKVFTELRKQREDKERFNRVGSRIKSEADLEEIMDGLQEQAMEDKKMRSYAVIPPIMHDARQRHFVYINENGSVKDMVAVHKERQTLNVWTTGEKELFKEKFLQHPKNFGAIAASLDRKSAQDCVRYYYLSKKTENYKQLLRKSRQRTRSSRNPQKAQQQQTQCIIDSLTTGVTTRLQREQQQKTGGRSAAAERERAERERTADREQRLATEKAAATEKVAAADATVTSTTQLTCATTATTVTTTSAGAAAKAKVAEAESTTTTTASLSAAKTTTISTESAATTTATSTTSDAKATSEEKASDESSAAKAANGTAVKAKANETAKTTGAAAATTTTSSSNDNQSSRDAESEKLTTTGDKAAGDDSAAATAAAAATTIVTTTAEGASTSSDGSATKTTTTGTPNGIKSTYAVAAAVAAAAAASAVPASSNDTAAPLSNSQPSDQTAENPAAPAATAAATPTTAYNYLGQKLKASHLDGGVGSDVNSDVSDPKKKRLDNESASLNNSASSSLANDSKVATSSSSTSTSSSSSTSSATTTTTTSAIATIIVATPDSNAVEGKDKLNACFVCKVEACPRTRPLKKGRGQQYGIPDETIPVGARVCNSCQCKSVRNRYPNCPLPTCPNAKDRAKRLHNIPPRLFELPADLRDPIVQEFQIPPQAARCCSACLMRIRRKLDPHVNLTDEERRTDGDESDASTSSCDERDAGGSDTASVDSPANAQMRHNVLQKSKSAQSIVSSSTVVVDNSNHSISLSGSTGSNKSLSDERLLPPLGQAPKKQKTSEEYDSSATETADEENENSPANRQSPKVILSSGSSSSSAAASNVAGMVSSGLAPPPTSTTSCLMLPNTSQPNGPSALPNSTQPMLVQGREPSMNVQDFLYTVIERSLKQKGPPPAKPTQPSTGGHSSQLQSVGKLGTDQQRRDISSTSSLGHNSNNDVTIVREFRNDGTALVKQQAHGQPLGSSARQCSISSSAVGGSQTAADNLATLSVVNSHMSSGSAHMSGTQNMLHQHSITATITPVKMSGSSGSGAPPPPHNVMNTPPPPHPADTIIFGLPAGAQPPPHSAAAALHQHQQQQQQQQQQQRNNEPEPQTLDLSIKKPARDGPSPHTSSSDGIGSRHHQPPPPTTVKHVGNAPSIYRGPEQSPLIGPPNPTYLYHPHSASVGKAPPPGSLYVSQVPVPISITQPGNGGRSQAMLMGSQQQTQQPPAHMQMPSQSSGGSGSKSGSKLPPKLSPQMIHGSHPQHTHVTQAVSPSQQQLLAAAGIGPTGPKGSITHGTPVNNSQQLIVHGSPANLSPKFDASMLRQTPPSGNEANKLGSITQGTPIHMPSHHLQESKRAAYEYYKSSQQRQSPAQQQPPPGHHVVPSPQQQQSSPQAPPPQNFGVNSPYARSPYSAVDQSPVLSTRQIVMHDYMTSQQMQGQQRNVSRGGSGSGGGSDKESPSPRNSVSAGSGTGLVYYDKERGRTDYTSRASPADHANSTPSPHRTPPPQRQGVIQRHNTGSKPPSPAAPPQNRLHVVMPHNYPPAGHDAFSSFVDVAVQQPQLPVPQKDEKQPRHDAAPPTQQQPPSQQQSTHHELRYQMNREHMAMQIQHHHQQQAAAAAAVQQQQQQQQAAAAAAAAQQQHQYRQQQAANAAAAADMHRRMEQVKRDQRMHACIERERDMFKRMDRERIERAHQERMHAERERIDRERERERERDRERDRERREQERAADEREREGRRMERIYAGNAAAAAAAAAANAGGSTPHYMRGPPEGGPPRAIPDRERDPPHPGVPQEGTLSAQSLIDAIIKHQISQGSAEPSPQHGRSSYYNARDIPPPPPRQHAAVAAENNGKSNSPNIINIDLDNDRASSSSQHDASQLPPRGQQATRGVPPAQQPPPTSSQLQQQQQPQLLTKNITFGELTDSIIAKDYGPNPMHLRTAPPTYLPYMQDPQSIVTPDRWKYNRRMQQKEAEAAAAVDRSKGPVQASSGNSNNSSSGVRSATSGDERQIIRMPQAVSPRKYMHDLILQQTAAVGSAGPHDPSNSGHYYHAHGPPPPPAGPPMGQRGGAALPAPHDQRMPGGSAGSVGSSSGSVVPNHQFDTMKYVKNRIVEAMRTEDERRADDLQQHHAHNELHRVSGGKDMHDGHSSRKTPNQYDERADGRRSSSSNASNSESHLVVVPSQPQISAYQTQQPPVTTFAPTTYAYPFSALNVPNSAGLPPPPQMNASHQPPPMHHSSNSSSSKQHQHPSHHQQHVLNDSGGGGAGGVGVGSGGMSGMTTQQNSSSSAEPKPLLSAQYEALSDED